MTGVNAISHVTTEYLESGMPVSFRQNTTTSHFGSLGAGPRPSVHRHEEKREAGNGRPTGSTRYVVDNPGSEEGRIYRIIIN